VPSLQGRFDGAEDLIIVIVLVLDGQLVEVSSDMIGRAKVDVPIGLPIGINPVRGSSGSSSALLLNADEVWVVVFPALVRHVTQLATQLTLGRGLLPLPLLLLLLLLRVSPL
jgi:hypothetical protein